MELFVFGCSGRVFMQVHVMVGLLFSLMKFVLLFHRSFDVIIPFS